MCFPFWMRVRRTARNVKINSLQKNCGVVFYRAPLVAFSCFVKLLRRVHEAANTHVLQPARGILHFLFVFCRLARLSGHATAVVITAGESVLTT